MINCITVSEFDLRISTPNPWVIAAYSDVTIQAQVAISSCSSGGTLLTWKTSPTNSSNFSEWVKSGSTSLRIFPYSLAVGSSNLFQFTAAMIVDLTINSSVVVNITVIPSVPIASIAGGDRQVPQSYANESHLHCSRYL